MRLTLYEIETTVRKASIGAGLPVGIAEDIGKAATWLVWHNFDGVDAALKSIQAGMNKAEMTVADKTVMIFPDARSAVCGPSVFDLLIGEKSCGEVHLNKPDSAILLIGFAGLAANQHGVIFQFDFSDGMVVRVSGDKVTKTGTLPSSGQNVVVRCCEDEQGVSVAAMPLGGVEVDDQVWHDVAKLAAKTYVPESKASRVAGAGAGLTDND